MEVNTIWSYDTVHKIDRHICRNLKGICVKRDVRWKGWTWNMQGMCKHFHDNKFLPKVSPAITRSEESKIFTLPLNHVLFAITFFFVLQRHEETGDSLHVLSIDIRCKLLWLILSESLTRTSLRMEKFILFCSTTQPCLDFWAKYESSNRSFIS